MMDGVRAKLKNPGGFEAPNSFEKEELEMARGIVLVYLGGYQLNFWP